jgi:glycerol-1-phosphate dehydrogenase [NAD(P)+]
MNPPGMPYLPWAAKLAQDILNTAIDCAEAAGKGERSGLKILLDCLMLEVQLCNQVGHARPEEGGEHYFAYAAENLTGPGWPHADLLGPGILLMMSLQGQEISTVKHALQNTNIPLTRIPNDSIETTLLTLADYCRTQNLPFGRAHALKAEEIKELSMERILK